MLVPHVVFMQRKNASDNEVPYNAFSFASLEEAEDFKDSLLTYTPEDLVAAREYDNPNATEEEVKAYVESRKIGIMSCEEYYRYYDKYLSSGPIIRQAIKTYLDSKLDNIKKEDK